MAAYKIITGDVLAELKKLSSNHFDAVLSDPPYGINFMGREWDKGVPSAEIYSELKRTLKPGAFGLHFGGTRTCHRLAVNLEDAGFEIRDTLMWLYGSGFPKSHNVSKAIEAKKKTGKASMKAQRQAAMGSSYVPTPLAGTPDYGNLEARYTGTSGTGADLEIKCSDARLWEGYGTALKPAWEPCILVQKPLDGTYANNALVHSCGALNIGDCRVGEEQINVHNAPVGSFAGGPPGRGSDTSTYRSHLGRWPANLILDEEAGESLDAQAPKKSRFFYCPKISAAERNAGCEALEEKLLARSTGAQRKVSQGEEDYLQGGFNVIKKVKNSHPTLKPFALTEYLARLLLPPKQKGKTRRILAPFSGAGSEMIGCLKAGWDEVWGIELSDEYVDIAHARIAHHTKAKKI